VSALDGLAPPVRLLARFSLAGFVAVVVLGTVRAAPTPLHAFLAAVPEAERAMASFHAHFDVLCWPGAAALALALHLLGPGGAAPAWAAQAAARGYLAGSLLFSSGYAVKALGLATGRAVLARGVAVAMISLGGLLLIGAGAAAALHLRPAAGRAAQR
jgi:hypothetical protein